jgi:8-oxo-dGTP diphosphatase
MLTEDVMASFRWLLEPVPVGMQVRQVYGFCFDGGGRLLLREDDGSFGLPGGTPEEGEPDYAVVLQREALEESQVRLAQPHYLGYQEVVGDEDAPPYAQVRLIALIEEFLPRQPDPATGRTYRRLLTPINRAPALLDWGLDGLLQSASAAIAALDHLKVDVRAFRTDSYRA